MPSLAVHPPPSDHPTRPLKSSRPHPKMARRKRNQTMPSEHQNGEENRENTAKNSEKRILAPTRWLPTLLLILPFSGVIVARFLTPDPRGLGTHQQLGLPPCSMRVLFNLPCPGCGMTTSWSLFSRGNFNDSIQTNTGGFLLACLATVSLAIGLHAIVRRKPASRNSNRALTISLLAIFGISLAQWLWRHLL